jgi:hypothetical protein
VAADLAGVQKRLKQLEAERAARTDPMANPAEQAAAATLAEMKERARKLLADLEAAKKVPSAKQTLRYRTPVSKPLQTEELFFECREGRVSLIDIGALVEDAQRRMRESRDLLRRQWEVQDDTSQVGAFRLHFVVERERSNLELAAGTPPDERASYRIGLSSWQVVPLDPKRGETVEQALAPGSKFRRVIDAIDSNQTAVTFWVYPDSFAVYRKLRDALHDKDLVVAGRPLPDGYPIGMSTRHGSASRGQ